MNIFILEDELPFARSLTEVLKAWGHQVVYHATGYHQAMQWLKNPNPIPDAAIVDICLGEEDNRDGIDVADFLAKKYHMPLVFYSGLEDASTLRLTAEYNAVQAAKGEWRTLKNTLNQIAERIKKQKFFSDPRTDYLTAQITINDPKESGKEISVYIRNIAWIETQLNGSGRIVLNIVSEENGKITSYNNSHTLETFVKALDARFPHLQLQHVFIRINRSTVINRNYIRARNRDEIFMLNKSFTLSEKYVEDLSELLPPKI